VDDQVTTGTDYWYAVTAYDDGTQNWAEPGKSLESAYFWCWTGYTSKGVTAPTLNGQGVDVARANRFALEQNAPNPFNPSTTIRFAVPANGNVRLTIYDVNGRIVRTLVDGSVLAGSHEVVWDGMDMNGRAVASGVYIYRLTTANNEMTKRMTLVR
jgi:flagellar hook assembly protein FlgD